MAKDRLGIGARRPDERALLHELERLVEAERVACPFSFFHVAEQGKYDTEPVRQEANAILGRLSRGKCIQWAFDLVAKEITAALNVSRGQAPASLSGIGSGLDCMPGIAFETVSKLAVAARKVESQFGYCVELVNGNAKIRGDIDRFIDTMLHIEHAAGPERERLHLALPQARAEERKGLVAGKTFKTWISQAAQKFGMAEDAVAAIVTADGFAAAPTLQILVEVRARRDVVYGRDPAQGDPMDAGHLLALPYADWFLTERFTASIAKDAGLMVRTVVLRQPEELCAALVAKFGP
jgi:hypothetical protein